MMDPTSTREDLHMSIETVGRTLRDEVEELIARLRQRLERRASEMNSAYDRYGMDNTPQSVDPDVWAAVIALGLLIEEPSPAPPET